MKGANRLWHLPISPLHSLIKNTFIELLLCVGMLKGLRKYYQSDAHTKESVSIAEETDCT